MDTPIHHRLEVAFWDIAIPALSQSVFVQRVVQTSYRCFFAKRRLRSTMKWIVIGLAGYISGLVLSFIVFFVI